MYFSTSFKAFVFVDKDPIPATSAIALDEIDANKGLRIKLRPTGDAAKPIANAFTDRVDPRRNKGGKDLIDSLIHPQPYANILSGVNAEDEHLYR